MMNPIRKMIHDYINKSCEPHKKNEARHIILENPALTGRLKCSCGFVTESKSEWWEHGNLTDLQDYLSMNNLLEHHNAIMQIVMRSIECPFCKAKANFNGVWTNGEEQKLDKTVYLDDTRIVRKKFPIKDNEEMCNE